MINNVEPQLLHHSLYPDISSLLDKNWVGFKLNDELAAWLFISSSHDSDWVDKFAAWLFIS